MALPTNAVPKPTAEIYAEYLKDIRMDQAAGKAQRLP